MKSIGRLTLTSAIFNAVGASSDIKKSGRNIYIGGKSVIVASDITYFPCNIL